MFQTLSSRQCCKLVCDVTTLCSPDADNWAAEPRIPKQKSTKYNLGYSYCYYKNIPTVRFTRCLSDNLLSHIMLLIFPFN